MSFQTEVWIWYMVRVLLGRIALPGPAVLTVLTASFRTQQYLHVVAASRPSSLIRQRSHHPR